MKNLSFEDRGDGLTVVKIDRQQALNALNDATIAEIDHLFENLASDDSVRAVILTGAGEKAFVAGADISELAEQGSAEGRARSLRGHRAFNRIENLGKPVVAAINGFALGGGCELAMACHLRFASSKAKLGLPEVSLGIIPGYAATQRLPRLVGRGVALQWLLSGEMMSAAEAHRIGLVNEVFEPEALLAESEKRVRKMISRGPLAIQFVLEAVIRGGETTLEEGQRIEADLFGLISDSVDMKEGMRAFLDKRSPEFRGC